MSCQVIRNVDTNEIEKVMALNGKESILYKDINSYIASKEESLLAYAQIYTPSFKEWFGDWEGSKEPVTKSSYASKLKNYYNEGFEERPDHKSWYVKDHLDIVQNVVDDLHTKYGGDKNILDLMVYTHDLAKAMNNEKMSHRETIEPVLKEMGIADNVINTVISNVEMMDKVKKEDVADLPVEVKILSTADALSHYTTGDRGFLNIFSNETSDADMSDIEASNKNKLAKDKRKILLPEFNLDDTKITYKNRTTSVAGSVTDYLNSLSKTTKETSGVSQVVDANGEPKLVFHWSPVHGIERFNLAGIGSHFGTLQAADEVNEAKSKTKFTLVDKELGTEEEMEFKAEPGEFYPAFLNLRNMAEIIDKGQHTEEKDGAEAKDLLDKGHDGFFYTNQYEDIGSTSYVATQENQIKSLYNKGTFSKDTGNIYANLKGEGEVNEPVTAGAIKQLEDEGMITKAGTALNTFTINEYTAENVNKIQDLLESKSIEYKRTGDNIKIYGLPVYKYSHEFVTLDTEEDEINTIQDLKKDLGITSKPLSFSQFNDIAKSLKAYNQQNETNYLLVADQQQDGSITVKTIVQDQTLNRSTLDVTQELMDRLQGLFPEIKVQYINQNELSQFSDGRFSNSDITVNTFVKDGIVYLVKDRFTGDMVVEEFLHPFVSAIMFDNPKLADSLYAEMLDRYPDIANMVEKTYTEAKGWSEEDRKNEIITKGLQRAFSERIQDSFKAKDKVAKGLIERVLDWITNIIRKLTGRKKLYTGELSSKMSVDDIINMLDSNVQVKLGLIDAKAYPNLSQEKIDILNYILKNATAEQKEVVEALFDNGIVHNEVDHTYEKVIFDENGEVEEIINYTSMTTAIKGEFTDTAYALNRDIGTEFDFIMNSVIMGEDFDVIKPQLKVVSEAAAANFYNMIMGVVIGIKSSGAIIVPQVVVGADADGIAGKMDMLIIDPSGKMRIIDLKTSATNDVKNDPKKYNKKYEITNEDSMLYGEELSNRDLHALQQHGYKRMIELDGRLTEYEVESVKTLHYRFKIEDGMATEVKPDDEVDHTDGHYDELLNKIIPSQPLERTSGFNSNLSTEAAKPENKETVREIRDLVKDASTMLQKRKEFYEKINETSKGKFIVTKEYLSALDDIIASLNEAILVGKPASAYYQLVKYINQDVKDKARTLGKMTDKSEGLQFMLEAEKDLNTYRELLLPPKLYLNNKTVTKLAQESHNVIQQTLDLINTEIHNFTVDFVANNTNRNLTREEIEGIIKEAEDISMHEYQFGDLSTSSDLLLSVMDKVYKRKRQEIIDFVQKLEIEIKTAGNKLAALSPDKKSMYDFMIGMDDKGNLTGYSVDKIGKKYWSMKRELRQKLTDPETGLRYKYREIRNPKDASQVDIDFNLNLKKLKDEETEFNKKEYLNDKGELVDGPYHKYSDEFKEARSKVMRLKIHKNAEGDPVSFEWIAKNKESKEFKEFQKKYYSGEVFYLSAKKEYDKSSKTYIFKGRTEENSDRFVKSEYVEIREIAENGEDMRDEKYVKIMTDNTELGVARREYYETWKRLYGELLEKLPDGVKMRTKLPVIQAGMIAQAKKMGGGANYYKGILKGVANKINPFPKSTFHHSTLLDENGNVVSNIPVFYTGDLKSEYAIEKTRERISELNQRWAKKTPDADGKVLSYQEYRTQLDKLTKSLKIEQGKTSANELSTEMTNNLVQFAEMAENFQVMSEFESTVISVLRTLKNRKVLKRDPDGNFITNSLDKATAKFKGDDSLAEQRLRKWMDMVLYNSKNPYRSRMGNFVKKVKLLMSVKGVGLNPFGQLNNLKMGNINNMVEAAGGTIFNKSDYKKAIKGYTVDYLPAFLSAKKDYILSKKSDKNGEYYTLPRSLTKYDALVNKYRMMRAMQSKDGIEGYEGKTMDLLFMMQHGAEFSIQSKSGIAVLHNRTFTNKVTGEKVSIYDAHSFDQKTGELILDSSLYEETDQDRYDMTNLIYETNKRLHGNYAWEDRMVIQQGLIGEMIAQFHKWVYPFVRRFWGKTYHDENLGETEGIFISFWKLNKAVYDMTKLDGSFWKGITNKQTFTEAWATMSDYQKSNITRLLGYFAFYLLSTIMKMIWSAIADALGDDEDTDPATMKLVNFMAYLDDRTMSEISVAINPTEIGQFVKNPVAIVGFIGDVWDALSESGKFILPWVPEEETIFQRGVNKGEYKWQKEWGDVLPFFSAINKWDSFEELKSFYIK